MIKIFNFETHILNITTFTESEIEYLRELILNDTTNNEDIRSSSYSKLKTIEELRKELDNMGRYNTNISRLDMVIIIKALEDLKEKQVEDVENKTYMETCWLIEKLKREQDGCDPKLDITYKED